MLALQKVAGGYDSLNHMMEEHFSGSVGDNLANDLLDIQDVAAILRESL